MLPPSSKTDVPLPGSSPEEDRPGHAGFILFCLVVIGLYVGTCVAPVIFDETEGQYAGAAREMLKRGDWLVPTNDGIPRLQKPPLVYWTQMVSYKMWGVNVFGARFPNAIATLAWILATYLIGERVGGKRLGLFGAMILASTLGFYIFTHLIMPEPFIGAWLSLTFWCFLSARVQPDRARWWFRLAWVFMALGCFTKGLHGLLYPLLVAILSMLVFEDQKSFWHQIWSASGIGLFLLIMIPWYLAIEVKFPGFLTDHFVNEQIGHLLDKRFPPDSMAVPSFIFWIQHLALFMPWTLFLPAAVWAWHHGDIVRQVPLKLQKILWLWILVTGVSIIFSARQDYYTMTCWGAVSILLALPCARGVEVPRRYLVTPCLILTLAGLAGLAMQGLVDRLMIDATFTAEPVADRDNVWNALKGFSFGSYQKLIPMMKLTSVALIVGGGTATWFAWRRWNRAVVSTVSLTMAGLFVLACWGMAVMGEYYSLAEVSKCIQRRARPHSMIVCQDQPHLATSLFFYLDQPVYWIRAHASGEFAPRVLGIGADLFLTDEAFEKAWKSSRQVFLITERTNLSEWQSRLGMTATQLTPVGVSGTRKAFVNR
jgi:4-amino-4-deoxy-L-arabinose transferase-like glycosyltransferase